MSVCCECCVLSGRGLCDELISGPEESYRLLCVVVCELETSGISRPWPTGAVAPNKKEVPDRVGISPSPHLKVEEDLVYETLYSIQSTRRGSEPRNPVILITTSLSKLQFVVSLPVRCADTHQYDIGTVLLFTASHPLR